MNTYPDNQIIDFIKDLFSYDNYSRSKLDVEITHRKSSSWKSNDSDCLDIKVTKMYEAPKLSFKEYKKLSEFFGTENIDKYNDISSSGCDTCDYGSEYGFVLRIW